MMKRMIGMVVLAAAVAQGAGKDGVFSVTEFGAVPDGTTDNTAAIQKAIDACADAGGGTVRVAGGAFMTYTLYPRSNTRLEIEAGASLEAGRTRSFIRNSSPLPTGASNTACAATSARCSMRWRRPTSRSADAARSTGMRSCFTNGPKGRTGGAASTIS
jgi:polygalacturonase